MNLFLGALLMMEGWIYRARASGGVRFVSQPDVQQEPHQFHPQGIIGVVGMTPSTCATAVRFLPQIDFQQVAPLQAVPPIDTASGITPGENFQDGIYMKQRNHISISPWKFRCSVQAAYVKHAISIKFNMHIRVQIARKPSEKIKALEQACGQPFLAAQTAIISLRELLRVMMVNTPCFKMSPMGGGYQGCFALTGTTQY
jgi:hypothetical protein